MRTLLCFVGLWSLLPGRLWAQPDSVGSIQRLEAVVQSGFIIPHSKELRPLAQTEPVGFELTYSRVRPDRRAWDACNCFARTGLYLSFVDYNNPAVLGQMLSLGGFFEPLLAYRGRAGVSVRATGGLAYLSRVHDPVTNPDNVFFSLPVSALLGLSLHLSYALLPQLDLTAAAHYNHISNGGIRQPNKGMNFPTLAVGLAWQPRRVVFPDYRKDRRPLESRWAGRVQVFGSVNVLAATDRFPEVSRPLFGTALTGLYRLNRFHALSLGTEVVADAAVRERIRRDGSDRRFGQVGLLAGYELAQGRYRFGLQFGYQVFHPGTPYSDRFYQRYQLLYAAARRLELGIGLRATGHVAKGFDLRVGWALGHSVNRLMTE
ncbi:acyloxyacyl hydrolase [Tellurirhabdus rosea]|uniref:acyloxyacyl hydrolase n=1 Tax=Tellurirhabdus rosea TaxID=2674997 RepID=UPI002258DCB2|nr:acyloxyacyl hydrolase [Tellurirhabdus rosea]